MDLLDCIAELLNTNTLLDMVQVAKRLEKPVVTREEASVTYGGLPDHITANDHRTAVATTLALVRLDGDSGLAQMRNKGIFRASRYGYRNACLKKVVGAALDLAKALNLSAAWVQYLESVLALLEVARSAGQIHRSIVQRLKIRHKTSLKTLLAIANDTFAISWPGNPALDQDHLLHWSATDIASAFSRLYMISRDELGIHSKAWIWTDDLASGEHEAVYSSLLVDAAKLNELIDAEVLIDGLPYKAEHTPTGVLVSAIDSDFERSVRLGYIQTDIQMANRVLATHGKDDEEAGAPPSFQEEMNKFFDAGLLHFASFKTYPKKRSVIGLPDLPPLLDLLNTDIPFKEEYSELVGAHIDYFQPLEAGFLQISKKLNVMDVLKTQRLFGFIDSMFRAHLNTVEDDHERRVLTIRSTVMVLTRADLQSLLEKLMSAEKAEELISLLALSTTSSTKGSDVHIDVQYKPFVHSMSPSGEHIAIPPAIVSKSNLVRSLMHFSKIKDEKNAADDPMQVAVANALREAGFLVRESFTFNISNNRETDIFCYRDGVLLVIECKNAYHPCSPHELRNSHDMILKANEQLDIRMEWLASLDNQSKLFKAMGWEVPLTSQVRTCIVTANRCFNGLKVGVHPVRQAHELINVLVRGYVGRGPEAPPRRFWHAETFHVADLVDYLDGRSVVEVQHAVMKPLTHSVDLRGRKLEFARFALDIEDISSRIDKTFDSISTTTLTDTHRTDAASPLGACK